MTAGVMVLLMFALIGIMFGAFLGIDLAQKGRYERERRERLEAACLQGNENACRIYQADFGR